MEVVFVEGFGLGVESAEADLGGGAGDEADDGDFVFEEHLFDEGVGDLGGADDAVVVGVDEVGGADVVVGFDAGFGLEAHEFEGGVVEFLDFGDVIFFEDDFLVGKGVVHARGVR